MFRKLGSLEAWQQIILLLCICLVIFFFIPFGITTFYSSGKAQDVSVLLSSSGLLKQGCVHLLASSISSSSGKEVVLDEAVPQIGNDYIWSGKGTYFKKLVLKVFTSLDTNIQKLEFRVGAKEFYFAGEALQTKLIRKSSCSGNGEFWFEFSEPKNNFLGIFNWSVDFRAFLFWFIRMLSLFFVLSAIMFINNKLFYKQSIFLASPLAKNSYSWFRAFILGAVSFLFTYIFSFFGFRWDEHLVAYGGQLIAQGAVPYLDFGIPLGPLVFILQSWGHMIFRNSFLAYGFSAAVLNALGIFLLSLFLIKVIQLRFLLVVLVAVVAHFSFFGTSGCLWYNPVAALWFTLAMIILICALKYAWHGFKYYLAIATISIFIGLTLITKHDLGLLAYIGIPCLYFFILAKGHCKLKIAFSVLLLFLVPALLVLVTIFYFRKLGADPLYWINIGQLGYVSRINFQGLLTSVLFIPADISFAPLLTSFWLILFLGVTANKSLPQESKGAYIPYFFLIVFVLGVSVIIKTSSGLGAGYLIPHLSLLGVLILLLLGKRMKNKGLNVGINLCIFPILMLSILCLAVPMSRDFFMRYGFSNFKRIEQGPLMGLRVTSRTKDFFEKYYTIIREIAQKEDRKLTAWSSAGLYQALHPDVLFSAYQGPLWVHLGVTTRLKDYNDLLVYFKNSAPDIIILEDFFYRLNNDCAFAETGIIFSYVNENYDLILSGYTDPIGSGGFSMEHFVFMRKGLGKVKL